MLNQLPLMLGSAVVLALGYLAVALFGPKDNENPEGLPKIFIIDPE